MAATRAKQSSAVAEGPIDAEFSPGRFIRRLHQISVALFVEETAELGVTPPQFSVLEAVVQTPGMDQRSVARKVGLDFATVGGVIRRLEARGLVARALSASDGRVRLLTATVAGTELLAKIRPAVLRVRQRLLAPLPPADRAELARLLSALYDGHKGLERDDWPRVDEG